MPKTIIAEGKTTNEAISNGLKSLNVSKDKVDIKVLENQEKRSFFSILAPRIVKVELTLRENDSKHEDKNSNKTDNRGESNLKKEKFAEKKLVSSEDVQKAKENVEQFLKEFSKNFNDINYKIEYNQEFLCVEIKGNDSSKLIGYRGDVLNSLQTIINSIANKNCESKIKVILDIADYKEKREKSLEELADKIAKTVIKNGKSITLEPMVAYERKIIHNRLQSNRYVKTYSIGEEPYRKVVVAKK